MLNQMDTMFIKKENIDMEYELYYLVPFPDFQKYQGTTDEEYEEYLEHSCHSMDDTEDFIEKEWLEEFENKHIN